MTDRAQLSDCLSVARRRRTKSKAAPLALLLTLWSATAIPAEQPYTDSPDRRELVDTHRAQSALAAQRKWIPIAPDMRRTWQLTAIHDSAGNELPLTTGKITFNEHGYKYDNSCTEGRIIRIDLRLKDITLDPWGDCRRRSTFMPTHIDRFEHTGDRLTLYESDNGRAITLEPYPYTEMTGHGQWSLLEIKDDSRSFHAGTYHAALIATIEFDADQHFVFDIDDQEYTGTLRVDGESVSTALNEASQTRADAAVEATEQITVDVMFEEPVELSAPTTLIKRFDWSAIESWHVVPDEFHGEVRDVLELTAQDVVYRFQ